MQKAVFALLTVIITVNAFVFYNLFVINGCNFSEIQQQRGVYILNHNLPILAVIVIEFCFAYSLEMILGSSCSFKIARRVFASKQVSPFVFETAIIIATV